MRNFTQRMCVTLCTIAGLLAMMPQSASAQFNAIKDFYGKWHFTATMELTEAGEAYASLLSNDCEVTIEQDNIYDAVIAGVAGGTETLPVNKINTEAQTLRVINMNSNGAHWGELFMANSEGAYPYNFEDPFNEMQLAYDATTGEITMPDFTAVACNHAEGSATLMAKFTNCKLTPVELTGVEMPDLNGDYHFIGQDGIPESGFPVEFDITLKSDDPSASGAAIYSVQFIYAGIEPIDLEGTFDGVDLVIPFKDIFFDADKTIAYANVYRPDSLAGNIVFKPLASGALSLSSGICISKYGPVLDGEGNPVLDGEGNPTSKFQLYQYSMAGTASKPTEEASFAGTYHITSAYSYNIINDYDYPTEFDIEIVKDNNDGNYYVTKFFGEDISALNYGGIPCTVEGNTLSIPTGNNSLVRFHSMADDYSWMYYDVLYDGLGTTDGSVTITLNDDGTCQISDFFVKRIEYISGKVENAMYYSQNSISLAKEFVPNFAGTYTVTSSPFKFKDDYDYPKSFTFEIEKDETTGEYILTSFYAGDIVSLTYGGIVCTVEGNTLSIPTGNNSLVRFHSMADDYSTIYYDALYDGLGTTDANITLTLNEDGSCQLSDFYVVRLEYMSNTTENAAYYGYNKIEKANEEEPIVVSPEFAGTYTVTSSPFKFMEDYNYPESFVMEIEKDEATATYYLTWFFAGDIYSLNYGGIPCTAEGNVLSIPTGNNSLVRFHSMADDYSTIYYDALYDGLGGTDSNVTLTLNDDGTCQLSDFFVMRLEYMSNTTERAAYYGYNKVERGGDKVSILDVEADGNTRIFAHDGTIYLAGAADKAQVYTASGACVFSGKASQISGLAKGLYIVKCGKATAKVQL